jgi:hypothetical protein
MISPEERVESMQQSGVIGAGQADALMAALGRARRPAWTILVDPFLKHGGGIAAAVGLFVSVVSLAGSRLGLRFDGFLDMHVGMRSPWNVAFADQLVAFPLSALVFWVVAGGRGRLIDHVGVVGVSRVPALLGGLAGCALLPARGSGVRLLVGVVPVLIALGWTIALLYAGHANASGLRGPRLGASLVASIVAAEVLSKAALSFLA